MYPRNLALYLNCPVPQLPLTYQSPLTLACFWLRFHIFIAENKALAPGIEPVAEETEFTTATVLQVKEFHTFGCAP